MTRLDDILAYCGKATKGPWAIGRSGTVILDWGGDNEWKDSILARMDSDSSPRLNSEFIAQARTDLPLVTECLRNALEDLEFAKLGYASHQHDRSEKWKNEIDERLAAIRAKLEGKL